MDWLWPYCACLENLTTHITIQYAWLNLFSSQNLVHTIYTYEASFSHEPRQCVFSFLISEKNTNHRGNIQKALCLHEPLKYVFSSLTYLWIHCYIFHNCILCHHQMIQHHAEMELIIIFFKSKKKYMCKGVPFLSQGNLTIGEIALIWDWFRTKTLKIGSEIGDSK